MKPPDSPDLKRRPDVDPSARAGAHARLAKAERLRKLGNLRLALSECEALIDQFPDYVAALHTLGLIHISMSNFWPALSCFVRAAMLNPKDWTILTNLAQVYIGLGAEESAIQTLGQAVAIKPDDANIHFAFGQIHEHQKEYELAAKSFERAVALDPSHAAAMHELGGVYADLGRLEDAARTLQRAYETNPKVIYSLASLSQLPASLVKIDVLAAIDDVYQNTKERDEDFTTKAGFARAAALHGRGRYEEAWKQLVDVNEILRRRYEAAIRQQQRRHEAALKRAIDFPANRLRPSEKRDDLPVSLFILGPSRSGKTSLEKLIGRLPGAKCGYESPIVQRAVRRTSQVSGLLTMDSLADLPEDLDSRFADVYGQELAERASGFSVFTNTHPGLIADVGRIAGTVPNCRFVFVKRDPDDAALRIFMKHYRKDTNQYAYDLQAVYAEISRYFRMIDSWADKLPPIYTIVAYESLVETPEAALTGVANLCGISLPVGNLPLLGDDRGCSTPYAKLLTAARRDS